MPRLFRSTRLSSRDLATTDGPALVLVALLFVVAYRAIKVDQLVVPLSYADELSALRLHMDRVGTKLADAKEAPSVDVRPAEPTGR